MTSLLKLIKHYISTGTFLMLSLLLYLFSDNNPYLQHIVEHALPLNGKPLAFVTILGFIFMYEFCVKSRGLSTDNRKILSSRLDELMLTIEKRHLISDVNAAFSEFKASGKESITGEYYKKEIMTLRDKQKELKVNSYTENKMNFLISKIQND